MLPGTTPGTRTQIKNFLLTLQKIFSIIKEGKKGKDITRPMEKYGMERKILWYGSEKRGGEGGREK